jgi:hypothetical protein
MQMRMPLFSYFTVVGTIVLGLLFWLGGEIEPNSSPLKTSQTVGAPRPFKAGPEPPTDRITSTNFAAAYAKPSLKPVKAAEAHREKKISSHSKAPTSSLLAEYPHDNLSIH